MKANTSRVVYISFLMILVLQLPIVAFSACNCPKPSECGDCKGGITKLTLRYTGSISGQLKIEDSKAVYFSGTLSPNQEISIQGTKNDGRFEKKEISLLIDGVLNATIDVDCGQPIFVNSTFGNFIIIAGESKDGGSLCCSGNATDTTAPVITNCPLNIEASVNTTTCTQSISWTPPLATDDCIVVSFTSTHSSGQEFSIGTSVVKYTATDAAGNISTCNFNVVVKDALPPLIQQCPADIHADTNSPEGINVSWNEPTVSANCDNVILNRTHKPGDTFTKGTTRVQYTVQATNSVVCQFNVIITERTSLVVGKFLTPDGDGINDKWKIGGIDKFNSNKVMVFDRWGNLIFNASSYNNESVAWDGTSNKGNFVPAGTYFYSIDIGDGTAVLKGFIEVIK